MSQLVPAIMIIIWILGFYGVIIGERFLKTKAIAWTSVCGFAFVWYITSFLV